MVAVAPMESAFGAATSGPVDVEVVDLSTGGSTVLMGALTYSSSVAADEMTVVSAPSGTVAVGTAAAAPFAVRVTLGDGVTPVAGVPVTFAATAGSVQFGACGTAVCVVLTDATGLASTTATPVVFGTATVRASAAGTAQSASFGAVARSVAAVQAVEYVAAGATGVWTPQVSVVENGAAAVGVVVGWSAAGTMVLAPGSSTPNALGMAETSAVVGPLAAGAQATGEACAWGTVCASFVAVGVDPAAWRVVVVSGAGQNVAAGTAFAPVVVMVTDAGGDPVAGAEVAVHQTVDAAEMACPARGPCPVAPVLASATGSSTSDANGLVSVVPMQIAGVGERTNVAVAAGAQGFATLTVAQAP